MWTASGVALAAGALAAAVRRPWHDELYTLELARSSFGGILAALRLDSGPPGYYLLCRLAALAGLDSVRALRVLSMVAVAAGVGLLVAALSDERARAWLAAGLLALHPLLLRAAGEARQYGIFFLLAAGAIFLLARGVTRRRAWALAGVLAAACWVHALGLVLAGALFAAALARPAEERGRIWLAVLGGLVLWLPWLPATIHQPPEALAWMARGWREIAAWQRPLLPFFEPAPVAPPSPFVALAALPGTLAVLGLGVWTLLAAAGLARWRRVAGAAVFWAAAGFALVAASALLRPVYAPGRADVLLIPAALLVVTAGVGGRRRRWVVAGGVLLALGGAAVSAASLVLWAGQPAPPSTAAARALARVARPGDVVVTTGWYLLDVRSELGPLAHELRWLSFPGEAARHPGWYDDRRALAAAAEVPALTRRLAAARRRGRRVWLLRTPGLASNRLLEPLAGELGLVPVAGGGRFWELWGPAAAGAGDGAPPPV